MGLSSKMLECLANKQRYDTTLKNLQAFFAPPFPSKLMSNLKLLLAVYSTSIKKLTSDDAKFSNEHPQ